MQLDAGNYRSRSRPRLPLLVPCPSFVHLSRVTLLFVALRRLYISHSLSSILQHLTSTPHAILRPRRKLQMTLGGTWRLLESSLEPEAMLGRHERPRAEEGPSRDVTRSSIIIVTKQAILLDKNATTARRCARWIRSSRRPAAGLFMPVPDIPVAKLPLPEIYILPLSWG
jgi:hypothetical protein